MAVTFNHEPTELEMSIVNAIEDVHSNVVVFNNIVFDCERIEDAAGHVFKRDDPCKNPTNLDWLLENERDFVVDMVSTARYCHHCAFDDVCDGFVGDIDPKCVRGNREWLLSPHVDVIADERR